MDNKKVSLLTLCDLAKAFDSVYYKIAIGKKYDMRIGVFWFEEYSPHQTQSVRIRANESYNFQEPFLSVSGIYSLTNFIHDIC